MSKTYIVPGKKINYLNGTGSAIASGDVVYVGNLPGVAEVDIADGEVGVVEVEGVHLLAKTTSLVITQGDRLFFNTTTNKITKTVTDNPIGTAWTSQASNDTTVEVKLMDVAAAVQAAIFDVAANVPALTDNGGGAAADGTIAAIPAATAAVTDTTAASLTSTNTSITAVAAAVKECSTKINAIITALVNAGIMTAP